MQLVVFLTTFNDPCMRQRFDVMDKRGNILGGELGLNPHTQSTTYL
jgi:hypothetical protein